MEMRGVGGIFYDYLGLSRAELPVATRESAVHAFDKAVDVHRAYEFTQDVGRRFLSAYVPIVESRRQEPWTDKERQFQLYRRGRYVEFNLLFDGGTQFGLRTGGRTESILASLPPLVRFTYDYTRTPDSPEASLGEFLIPRDWANGG
ncbi:MAG: coproporphyrinogen III oxidase [Myxococcota bacterium]|jgi:coproporphyrinogen III oxidase